MLEQFKENKKQPFIITVDKDVADKLTKCGFTLLSFGDNHFMFMNDGVLTFEGDEDKNILTKMAFTNKMLF